MADSRTVDPALSLKRRIAGRRGAQARWAGRMANDSNTTTGPAGGRVGYEMANATTQGGRAVVDIHGEIGIWGVDAAAFIADLRDITSDEIELHISSPGGDVFDGIEMYWALVDHPAAVEVRVDSLAGSIASVIAQAGDRVLVGGNAQFMIHDAIGGVFGNATEMRHMAEILDTASDNIASIYAERSDVGTVRSWRAKMTDGVDGTWFTAEEAVEAGLADEVVKAGRRSGADPKDQWRESFTARLAARTRTTIENNLRTDGTGDKADAAADEVEPAVEISPESTPADEAAAPSALNPAKGADAPTPDWEDLLAEVDLSGVGVALRRELDEFSDYNPDIIRAAIEDATLNAPSCNRPPPETPDAEPTLDDLLLQVGEAMKESLQS